MTPQEMLAKGIAEDNMDLIKEANNLLQQLTVVVKKPRGRPKKKISVKGKNKLGPKKKKQKEPEGNFLEQLYNIEEERFRKMIEGGVGGIMKPNPIALDDDTYFVKEHEEDLNPVRGLGKDKRKKVPRRPAVKFIDKNCPRCQKKVKISSNDLKNYSFDMSDENSMLPTYNCGCVN